MRIGLYVNPIAGMGGSVGLAGTDGADTLQQAVELGAQPRASTRCVDFLTELFGPKIDSSTGDHPVEVVTLAGDLGEKACIKAGVDYQLVANTQLQLGKDTNSTQNSTLAHEKSEHHVSRDNALVALKQLVACDLDILVFVGGDGTARDVLDVASAGLCVLGIPAGVKMHSGVFAVTPSAGAKVIQSLINGGLVSAVEQDVRDFVNQTGPDQMQVSHFGELFVPDVTGYMQHVKVGGVESEALVRQEICAFVCEQIEQAQYEYVLLGPGSTCLDIKQALGITGTLRGFDLYSKSSEPISNITAAQIERVLDELADSPVLSKEDHRKENPKLHVVMSFTRQQGFLLGRGNQQLTSTILNRLGWPEQFTFVGSRTKLKSLDGRALLIDTGDSQLDQKLSGLINIVAGYDDFLLYRVASDLLPVK